MFQIYDTTESPNEDACCRYMTKRNRKRGNGLRYDEPESPKEGACLRYRMKRNHQMRGRAVDTVDI